MPRGIIRVDEESIVGLKLDRSDNTLAFIVYNPDQSATNYLDKKTAIKVRDVLIHIIDKMQ